MTVMKATPPWYTTLSIDDDECAGFWTRHWDVPDWVDGYTHGGRWPRCKVVHVPFDENTGRDYFHIVVHENPTTHHYSPYYRLGWVRCYLDQTIPYPNLISETYYNWYRQYTTPAETPSPGPLCEPIALVDTASFVDAVVEASPVSKRVAIVYTSAVDSDHAHETYGCDVVFVESMNNGDDWLGIPPPCNPICPVELH